MTQVVLARFNGDLIRDRRKALNITQFDLAKKTNVSQAFISRIENNDVAPGLQTSLALSKILDFPIEDVFLFET